MSETVRAPEPPYHLHLDLEEASVSASAMRLLIADEAHEPHIRQLARDVLAQLDGTPSETGKLTVTLGSGQMKVMHSAVRLLLADLQREQADERSVLRRVLAKLPDEHTMRAIELE